MFFLLSPHFVKPPNEDMETQSILSQLNLLYKIINESPLLTLINCLCLIREFKRF
ncbi:hypothetical protein HanRHA438_Chr11g0486861 [Helianthus annuus]|nr:hypothetical protein HanRHA438_Chr11g0486861 [Helianthus annuus]